MSRNSREITRLETIGPYCENLDFRTRLEILGTYFDIESWTQHLRSHITHLERNIQYLTEQREKQEI